MEILAQSVHKKTRDTDYNLAIWSMEEDWREVNVAKLGDLVFV